MTADPGPRTLQTVEKSWEIIEALKRKGEMGVTELAREVELSKGGVHTHLATLCERGVVMNENGTYRLGLHILNLGEYVRRQQQVFRAGKQEVDKLAEETDEFAHLMVQEYGKGIYLYQSAGERAIVEDYMMEKYQKRSYLHHSSLGKAILAHLPEEKVEQIIDRHGLPDMTNNTITTREKLFENLKRIRKEGVALNHEEHIPGAFAVGAPIIGADETVYGAVSVSCPSTRLENEFEQSELRRLVKETANLIEVNLQTQSGHESTV